MAQTKMQVGFIESLTASVTELNILDGATANATELNLLDNVSGLVQADLIKLAAINSTATELNLLNSVSGLVQADLTKLAAVDSTAVELNLLNGVSGLVQADLTKLAAVDSSAAELNLLDGVSGLVQADLTKLAAIDSTAVEINLLDALDRGSILYGNASGVTTVLGQGGTDTVLTSDGTDISWQAAGGGVVSGGTNNAILRADGTGGSTSQGSAVTIADTTGDITLPAAGQIFLGVGAAANPSYAFICGTNTGIFNPSASDLAFTTAGAERLRILGSRFLWGDTGANAKSCNGVTINQACNDGEILTFKSNDISHGMTALVEADTYGRFAKYDASVGGLYIRGFREAGAGRHGLWLEGTTGTQGDTNKNSCNTGIVTISATVRSGGSQCGTASQGAGSNTNLVSIQNAGVTKFIFDADGDSHQDVGTAWTNFDDQCDIAILDRMRLTLQRDPLRGAFVDNMEANKAALDAIPGKKIITFNDDGHHFLNTSRLAMLHHGAILQMHDRVESLETQLKALSEGKINGNNI